MLATVLDVRLLAPSVGSDSYYHSVQIYRPVGSQDAQGESVVLTNALH